MSLLTVYIQDTVDKYKYSELTDNKTFYHVDLQGNSYIKHNDDYYMIFIDIDYQDKGGVELMRINNVNVYKQLFLDNMSIRNSIKKGVIKSSELTLKGKTIDHIKNLNDDAAEVFLEKNDYSISDSICNEKKYFRVTYDEDNFVDEDEIDDSYYFNGVVCDNDIGNIPGIIHSDLLCEQSGNFDVVMIKGDMQSKNIISSIERVDGYSIKNLVVFTSGFFKSTFIEKTINGRLCFDTQSQLLYVNPL